MAIKQYGFTMYEGLSTDTKPDATTLNSGIKFHETDTKSDYVIKDNSWVKVDEDVPIVDGSPIGSIVTYPSLTPPEGYLLCDGSTFEATLYPELNVLLGGNTLPDLRMQFIRGTDNQAKLNGFPHHQDTTRRPRAPFQTNQTGNHYHSIGAYEQESQDMVQQYHGYTAGNPSPQAAHMFKVEDPHKGGNEAEGDEHEMAVSTDGQHSHTINAGGDAETVPRHVYMAYHIKGRNKEISVPRIDSGVPLGTVINSMLNETEINAVTTGQWALCDGRDITGSGLASITSLTTVPDMRGAYIRMAGQNASNTNWAGGALNGYQDDTTRRPFTPFTMDSRGNHHHFSGKVENYNDDNIYKYGKKNLNSTGWVGANTQTFGQGLAKTDDAGNHSHNINGGGDTETRPKTYSLNYFIRIN